MTTGMLHCLDWYPESCPESYPRILPRIIPMVLKPCFEASGESYPESYLRNIPRIIPPNHTSHATLSWHRYFLRNSHICHTVHIIYFDSYIHMYIYIYIRTIPFDLIFLEPAFSFPPVPSCFFTDRTSQPLYLLWRRTWTELAGQRLVSLHKALSNPYFWGGVR